MKITKTLSFAFFFLFSAANSSWACQLFEGQMFIRIMGIPEYGPKAHYNSCFIRVHDKDTLIVENTSIYKGKRTMMMQKIHNHMPLESNGPEFIERIKNAPLVAVKTGSRPDSLLIGESLKGKDRDLVLDKWTQGYVRFEFSPDRNKSFNLFENYPDHKREMRDVTESHKMVRWISDICGSYAYYNDSPSTP